MRNATGTCDRAVSQSTGIRKWAREKAPPRRVDAVIAQLKDAVMDRDAGLRADRMRLHGLLGISVRRRHESMRHAGANREQGQSRALQIAREYLRNARYILCLLQNG
jgi:hypothetical protein